MNDLVRYTAVSEAATDVGTVRRINEDAYLAKPELGLWAVADGMGGHAAGDVASKTIIEMLSNLAPVADLARTVEAVEQALLDANRRLVEIAAEQKQRTIGSTVAVLAARDRYAACLWAGDSRIYRMRRGHLEQLTQDHAMVEDLVASGALTRAEAENHPQANRITRAVGAGPELFVDIELFKIEPGDRFLLCSDGLYKELRDPEIAVALTSREAAGQELVSQAVAKGARDNVTVIDIRVER